MSMNSMKLSPTKQLLIIGNWFDKHLGLKSLYVEYYLSLTVNERKNNIFTYLASNKNYNWADVEALLLKCLIIIKKLDAQTVKNYDDFRRKRTNKKSIKILLFIITYISRFPFRILPRTCSYFSKKTNGPDDGSS